ncbi:MAG: D-alanyl-D-alanine carboxypeptidase (penicillin-binding protein 5/6) [Candidatus Azotimanducaceae bacterium]|jgi:D-alanyl-D-alanine carboxypeptidase (penicillin-binding protein 5/6)
MQLIHQDLKTKEKGVGPIRTKIKKFGYLRALCASAGLLWAFSSAGAAQIIPAAPQLSAEGYLLIDAGTGKILVEHNSQQRLPPASLTKMMTSYVASSEIINNTLKIDEDVDISVRAWRTEGSRMFVKEGTKVKVSDLLSGIIIQSGNDASVALAEHIAGSEDAFADVMNQQAELLGMVDSHFMNATGLPDENHYTTASDLAKLTIALINDYPEHYKLYGEKYFTYNDIRQPNRNQLLWRDKSVDGVKTGHTSAAGYCLVSSAVRNGMRLISVVMGAQSEEGRAVESQRLLSYGFRYYETLSLYKADEVLKKVRVWGGQTPGINLGLAESLVITVPRGAKETLKASMDIQQVIKSPIKKGQLFGKLTVVNGDEEIASVDLVALMDQEEGGFFKRLWDSVALFFTELFSGDTLSLIAS